MSQDQLFLALGEVGDGPRLDEADSFARQRDASVVIMDGYSIRHAIASNLDDPDRVLFDVPEGPWPFLNAALSLRDVGRVLMGEIVQLHAATLKHVELKFVLDPAVLEAAMAETALIETRKTIEWRDEPPHMVRALDLAHMPRSATPSLSSRPFLAPEEPMPALASIEDAEHRAAIRGEASAASRGMGFTGEACLTCGSFAMVRTGTYTTCQECSATSGCG